MYSWVMFLNSLCQYLCFIGIFKSFAFNIIIDISRLSLPFCYLFIYFPPSVFLVSMFFSPDLLWVTWTFLDLNFDLSTVFLTVILWKAFLVVAVAIVLYIHSLSETTGKVILPAWVNCGSLTSLYMLNPNPNIIALHIFFKYIWNQIWQSYNFLLLLSNII